MVQSDMMVRLSNARAKSHQIKPKMICVLSKQVKCTEECVVSISLLKAAAIPKQQPYQKVRGQAFNLHEL
jgi:hypothetical protein